jgi:hypothetical protein
VFEYAQPSPGGNRLGWEVAIAPRRPRPTRVGDHGPSEGFVPLVVEQAARVVEQLAKRDRSSVRNEPGKPTLNGVVEAELPIGHELEHDRGHEGLREARYPEAVGPSHRGLRPDAPEPAPRTSEPGRCSNDRERAGRSVCDESVGEALKPQARIGLRAADPRTRHARRRREPGGGEGAREKQHLDEDHERLLRW